MVSVVLQGWPGGGLFFNYLKLLKKHKFVAFSSRCPAL